MNLLKWIYFFALSCTSVIAGTVQKLSLRDNQSAIKGTSIQLVCYISQYSSQDVVSIFKTDSRIQTGILPIALVQCIPSACLSPGKERYTYSADNSNVYVNITNLDRSEDQKWWTCVLGSQRKDVQLTVYTVPQSLQFDRPPSQGQDLAENAVTLSCSTGCVYPQPLFKWFFSEEGGSRQEWSTSGSVTDTLGTCTDSERIYKSTLSLPRFTTFPGNLDKTVKFTCGISTFTGITQPLYTNPSVSIQFAVQVKSVTLKDGNSVAPSSIQVTSGVSKSLTCSTSVSRPTATIVWYFEKVEKQRSSSSSTFIFTPQIIDHDKQIFCKAYNMQPESQAVSSNKALLNVQVQVKSVTLKDGNSVAPSSIQVTSGVSKTLTCTTSVSRPLATIVWYIGTVEKQRSNITFTLTFIPQNSDHDKQIFCKAFNVQQESQAVSSNTATLYVQVLATTPTITNSSLITMENDSDSVECISSSTRPVAIVTWRKETELLTNVRNINITTSGGLMSVRSIVTFTPRRSDDSKIIYCETAIPGQQKKPVSQQKITVYWPPSIPFISATDFPFLEGQSGKALSCNSADYGNPIATASWDSDFGTQDSSDSTVLILPKLNKDIDKSKVSCQLINQFTQAKGVDVTSLTIIMDVQYKPDVRILQGGQNIQTVTKVEGQNLAVTCSAVGNPVPTVKWIGQTLTGSELRFNDIDRNDHGTYTCSADAASEKYPNHDFVALKNLTLVVVHLKKADAETVPVGAVAAGCTVASVIAIVVIIIVVVFIRKKRIRGKADNTSMVDGRSPYESLHRLNDIQTTYSSLSAVKGNPTTEDEVTYKNLRLNIKTKSTESATKF